MARPRKNSIAVYVNGKLNEANLTDYICIRTEKPSKAELELMLKAAVEEERYEQAAKYRDQLKRLC